MACMVFNARDCLLRCALLCAAIMVGASRMLQGTSLRMMHTLLGVTQETRPAD